MKKPRMFQFSYRLVALLVLYVILGWTFAELLDEVREGSTIGIDEATLNAIYSVSNSTLDTFFLFFTDLGGVIGGTIIAILLFAALAYLREYTKLIFAFLVVVGSALINTIVKLLVERPRPELWEQLITETTFSFPSGHAMGSMSIAIAASVVGWKTKYRYPIVVVALIYAIGIGISRLYLGVHYPSDVVGGWLLTGAWAISIYAIVYGHENLGYLKRQLSAMRQR